MAKVGRKTKYRPDTVQKLTEALELGATHELACNYAGISYSTFAVWQNTIPEFLEAVKEAEGRAAIKWLVKIELAASDGNWQAAAWKLERRYPNDYGKKVVDVTSDGKPLELAIRYVKPREDGDHDQS